MKPRSSLKSTVLVVDDTPDNIDLIRGILEPMYDMQVATNGHIALALANREPRPDLILLDVVMPEMNGHDVCRQLKANPQTKDIPVIFITARSEVEDVAYGFSLGAADYITKPMQAAILLARVRTHLSLGDERHHLEELVAARTLQLETTQMELIYQLGRAAEFRDNETSAHTLRMAHFSRLLAERLGMDSKRATVVMYASMMHDVGKIGIPDDVLLKPGKLTAEEFEIIKEHPEIGGKIIGVHDAEVLREARNVALSHHEKWNGKGYPRGLKGKEIPLVGRICALADVFDALTSPRVYKRSWSIEEAFTYIRTESGEHFDPELAALFLELEPELRHIQETYRDEDETK